jgi:hypothetical protein
MTERQLHRDTIEIAIRSNLETCNIVLETLEGNKVEAWKNMQAICTKALNFIGDPSSDKLDFDLWLEEINQLLAMLDEARKLL